MAWNTCSCADTTTVAGNLASQNGTTEQPDARCLPTHHKEFGTCFHTKHCMALPARSSISAKSMLCVCSCCLLQGPCPYRDRCSYVCVCAPHPATQHQQHGAPDAVNPDPQHCSQLCCVSASVPLVQTPSALPAGDGYPAVHKPTCCSCTGTPSQRVSCSALCASVTPPPFVRKHTGYRHEPSTHSCRNSTDRVCL